MTFNRCRAVPLVTMKERNHGETSRFHAWNRANVVQEFAIEVCRVRIIVSVQGGRELECHQILHFLDAGVCGPEVLQTSHKKTCAKKQQEAQRDLSGDETLAQDE